MIIGAILCFTPFAPIGVALITAGLAMLFGQIIGGQFGAYLVILGSVAAVFIGGPLAGLAAGFAGYVGARGQV